MTTQARHRRYIARPAVFVPELPAQLQPGVLTFTVQPLTRAAATAAGAALGDGASVYLDGAFPAVRQGTCYGTAAAVWFGQSLVNEAVQCGEAGVLGWAWEWLQTELRREWAKGSPATMLATPGSTGRDLWLRTVPARGWAQVDAATGDHLRATCGQARTEVLAPHSATIAELVEYDQRLAYGAVTRNLPCGQPVPLSTDQAVACLAAPDCLELVRPGRWLVEFLPPADWAARGLAGILPVRTPARWTWPTEHRWHGPADVSGAELQQARRAGWEVRAVGPGCWWPTTCDPFRTMTDRLDRITTRGLRLGGIPARLVRAACRNILLHTLGAMHGNGHRVSRTGTVAEFTRSGAGAGRHLLAEPGRMAWVELQQTAWPETSHPEWTTQLWAVARGRLLSRREPDGSSSGLLHLPAGVQAVAIRTDAVYLTGRVDWADDGRSGQFVQKRHIIGPMSWPADRAQLLAMRGS